MVQGNGSIKKKKDITASTIKDLLIQNHTWDLYLNIEKKIQMPYTKIPKTSKINR
jgi:hypothetical protein